MRFTTSIIIAILIGLFFGYINGLASNNALYVYCAFPIVLSFVASRIIIAVTHRFQIRQRRPLLLVALLCGIVMVVSYQLFSYRAFMDRAVQDSGNNRPVAEVYELIDKAFIRETGNSGYIGYFLWKINHTVQTVRIYSALPGTTGGQKASPWDALIPVILESLIFLMLPLGLLHLHVQHIQHEDFHESMGANSKPIAYFRNPENEMATEVFRAKDWSRLAEMVYAGSATSLPALEIHQSGNVVTGNPYVQLVQRVDAERAIPLKTQPVTHSELDGFVARLPTA